MTWKDQRGRVRIVHVSDTNTDADILFDEYYTCTIENYARSWGWFCDEDGDWYDADNSAMRVTRVADGWVAFEVEGVYPSEWDAIEAYGVANRLLGHPRVYCDFPGCLRPPHDPAQPHEMTAHSGLDSQHADWAAGRPVKAIGTITFDFGRDHEEAEEAAAKDAEIARLRERLAAHDGVLARVRPLLAEMAEQTHYGAPHAGMSAKDFTPDPDCCTPEELAAHAAALAAETTPTPDEVHGWGLTDRDIAYTDRDGVAKTLPAGSPAHFNRTPWGIGTMTLRDPEMAVLLAEIDMLLPVPPPDRASVLAYLRALPRGGIAKLVTEAKVAEWGEQIGGGLSVLHPWGGRGPAIGMVVAGAIEHIAVWRTSLRPLIEETTRIPVASEARAWVEARAVEDGWTIARAAKEEG